jgi:hypothetical protein
LGQVWKIRIARKDKKEISGKERKKERKKEMMKIFVKIVAL